MQEVYFKNLINYIQASVILRQPHIVCIVETWLSSDISDVELCLTGYQLFGLDRSRHGGGIVIFFLVSNEIHDLELMAMSVNTLPSIPNFCMSPLSSSIFICLYF